MLYLVLKPLTPWLDYAYNYHHITEDLCINKTHPELQCNGKCYLAKSLVDQEDSHTKSTSTSKIKTNIVDVYLAEVIYTVEKSTKILHHNPNHFWKNFYNFQIITTLLKPPIN